MAPIIRPRAPDDKGYFSGSGSNFTVGRENSKVLSQLENSYQQQSYLGYSQGLGSAIEWTSIPNPFPSGGKNEQTRGVSHGSGNREHAHK